MIGQRVQRLGIYLVVLLALSVPLIRGWSVAPRPMPSAVSLFNLVEQLPRAPDRIVFLAFDFGPNSKAENEPQAEVVVEHLMRRRIPFALFSQVPIAVPFLDSIPNKIAAKLTRELPQQRWEYGKDWLNIGFRPGTDILIQSIPKSEDLRKTFIQDAKGTKLAEMPIFSAIKTIRNISALIQLTSLVGTFESYIQFFQGEGYRPLFGHGCTSISIPKAYIYLDSGQLDGLLEGVAGAAWYDALLDSRFSGRIPSSAGAINTGLGVAQLMIVLMIILGNLQSLFFGRR